MRSLFCLFIIIIQTSIAFGQLRFDTSKTAEVLVRDILLKKNSDLLISNIRFSGLKQSIAFFRNETLGVLMDAGIILSTGNVFDAMGPNNATNTGGKGSGSTDVDLQAIATGVINDAVVLEFDLVALRDSLEFTYVFASEEYPEYVDQGVNDVFGFFINEINDSVVRPINIARLPGSQEIVSIDNVNHRNNENYFLKSDLLSAHSTRFWQENLNMMLRARFFEFDGCTIALKAVAELKEGKQYHLKLAIADVGDRFYDSAVLIKARSLSSAGQRVSSADSIMKTALSEKINPIATSSAFDENFTFSMPVNFGVNDAKIQATSLPQLEELLKVLNEFPDIKVKIIGHTDAEGSREDNLILSKQRAEAVKRFLELKGIDENRLSTTGSGENKPLAGNQSPEERAENRRVEFQISY